MSSPKTPIRRAEFVQIFAGVFLVLFSVRLALVLSSAPEMPYYDEWDAVIDGMARPMLAGNFSPGYLLVPHNGHPLLWTKILNYLLLRAGGLQFDNVPVCEVSQLVYAGIAAALIALAANKLTAMDGGNAGNAGSSSRLTAMDGGFSRPSMASAGRSRPSMVSAALGLLPGGNAGNAGGSLQRTHVKWWFVASAGIAAALPYGWENIGMGWGSSYYFLVGFSVAAIVLASAVRGSAGALVLLGIVAIAAGVSMASGFFADLAALLALGMRVRIGTLSARGAVRAGIVLLLGLALPVAFVIRFGSVPLDWGMLQSAELAVLILLLLPTWILLLRLWRGQGSNADVAFACISLWSFMQVCTILLGRPAFRLWYPVSRYVDVLELGAFANLGCLCRLASVGPPHRNLVRLCRVALMTTAVLALALAPLAWHWMNVRAANQREQTGRVVRYIHAGDIDAIEHAPAEALPYPSRERLRQLLDAVDVRLILGDAIGTRSSASAFVENVRTLNGALAAQGSLLLPLSLALGLLVLLNARRRELQAS